MRVLVACEFSGTVREAFAKRGHDAWSCDLLPTEKEGKHIQGDIRQQALGWLESFDLIIAHPPCTYLCVSGARWWKDLKNGAQEKALDFVDWFLRGNKVPYLALENPIGIISSKIRKPDQIIHPWMFGHSENKATCLWLRNLPKLERTELRFHRKNSIHRATPGKDRWKERSRTFQGIADAMADQWGSFIDARLRAS